MIANSYGTGSVYNSVQRSNANYISNLAMNHNLNLKRQRDRNIKRHQRKLDEIRQVGQLPTGEDL